MTPHDKEELKMATPRIEYGRHGSAPAMLVWPETRAPVAVLHTPWGARRLASHEEAYDLLEGMDDWDPDAEERELIDKARDGEYDEMARARQRKPISYILHQIQRKEQRRAKHGVDEQVKCPACGGVPYADIGVRETRCQHCDAEGVVSASEADIIERKLASRSSTKVGTPAGEGQS